jgi:hypothetical protein
MGGIEMQGVEIKMPTDFCSKLISHYNSLEVKLNRYTQYCDSVSYIAREMDIIQNTLNLMDIKIEGINCHKEGESNATT